MSKFLINLDTKIVKLCPSTTSTQADDEPSIPTVAKIEDENFLENVDEEILYVDSSIEIKLEQSTIQDEIDAEVDSVAKISIGNFNFSKEPPACFHMPPDSLSSQISLPLHDVASLFFYEVFMISEPASNSEASTRLIPGHNEIDEVGSCSVLVEGLEDENILVYITVQMSVGGEQACQEVLSIVDKNLQTLNEKRIERTCLGGQLTEKSLHIFAKDDGNFRLVKSKTKDGETEQWKSDVEWNQPGDFLSCGANILLTRRLVMDKFVGCIHSWTNNIDGEFFLSQHWFIEPENMIVLDQPVDVRRVNRLLISDEIVSRLSSFFLAGTGGLLKEICTQNPYTVHLNPFSDLPPKNCIKDLSVNWPNDIQLMSLFLDFKEKRKDELHRQLHQPRVENILRDYILCLVKSKPKSVMNFTLDFVRKLERDGNVQLYQTVDRRHQQNSK